MIEAPVQITDEYVRKYLWEHNLVAVDEGDLRRLMQPTRMLAMPELMEQAGWVRKKEWQELSDYDVDNIVKAASGKESAVFLTEAKLRGKNG